MHAAMRTLEPTQPNELGSWASLGTTSVAGPKLYQCSMLFAKPSYYGQFTDSGGLRKGDRVRTPAWEAPRRGLRVDGDHRGQFSIGTNTIGTESRLAIRTDTIRQKVLDQPRGAQRCRPGFCRPGKAPPRTDLRRVLRRHQRRTRLGHRDGQGSLNVLSETVGSGPICT